MQNSVMPPARMAKAIYDNCTDTRAGAIRTYSVCCNKFLLLSMTG